MSASRDARIIRPAAREIRTVCLAGTGSYLPERVLTNAELEKMVDTTNEWIVSRTGMKERHIAAEDEASSDMAAVAALRALEDAKLPPEAVQAIIVATSTPDMAFPSTACITQEKIGAKSAFCMDVSAACSGFLFALDTARQYIASGDIDSALVIGAEKMSCIVDWQDRATCVLFGDAAGAVVLQAAKGHHGILSAVLGSDGSLANLLRVPAGGSRMPASEKTVRERLHTIKMEGKEVFKYAVTNMAAAATRALEECGLTIDDVNLIVPHQANQRIIHAIGQRVGASLDKFYINVDRYGNTSAASIGVALDEASRGGRLRKGDVVLLVGFGGGFAWGATVLEWTKS